MNIKRSVGKFAALGSVTLASISAHAEDWKGDFDKSEGRVSAMVGMGIVDNTVGFAMVAAASKKIVKQGFVSDMSNSVSIEALLGPVLLPGDNAWLYSAHLRWDFVKDEKLILFATGGLGGNARSVAGSTQFRLFPRFGVGTFYTIQGPLSLRAEITHDLIAAGVALAL